MALGMNGSKQAGDDDYSDIYSSNDTCRAAQDVIRLLHFDSQDASKVVLVVIKQRETGKGSEHSIKQDEGKDQESARRGERSGG